MIKFHKFYRDQQEHKLRLARKEIADETVKAILAACRAAKVKPK